MENKVSRKRWDEAQDSEKDFWKGFTTEEIRANHEDSYKKEIETFLKRWERFIPINKKTKVLQIGCGPLDIINYLKFGELYSVDPLADSYKNLFDFDYKKSNLIQASGELLPYKDKTFDLVLLANVLDHVKDTDKVLSEANRVLKDGGLLHFECAYYQPSFLLISRIYGKIKKILTKETFNIHHPHMLTLKELKNLLNKYFLLHREMIGERVDPPSKNLSDLRKIKLKGKLTQKIPAFFGLLGNINYSALCTKKHK